MVAGDVLVASLDFEEAISIGDEPEPCEIWRESFAASVGWVDLAEVAVPGGQALEKLCRSWEFPTVLCRGWSSGEENGTIRGSGASAPTSSG